MTRTRARTARRLRTARARQPRFPAYRRTSAPVPARRGAERSRLEASAFPVDGYRRGSLGNRRRKLDRNTRFAITGDPFVHAVPASDPDRESGVLARRSASSSTTADASLPMPTTKPVPRTMSTTEQATSSTDGRVTNSSGMGASVAAAEAKTSRGAPWPPTISSRTATTSTPAAPALGHFQSSSRTLGPAVRLGGQFQSTRERSDSLPGTPQIEQGQAQIEVGLTE
jgi:hypothetical protein